MEKEGKTVSIIVPVYQVREYLDVCVQSVLAQTYTDLEIILVDDGSTDGSEKFATVMPKRMNGSGWCIKKTKGFPEQEMKGLSWPRGSILPL